MSKSTFLYIEKLYKLNQLIVYIISIMNYEPVKMLSAFAIAANK